MLLGYLYLVSNTDLEGFRHIFSCLLIIFTWKFHWPLKLVDFTPKMLLLLCFLCQKCICPSGWIILGSFVFLCSQTAFLPRSLVSASVSPHHRPLYRPQLPLSHQHNPSHGFPKPLLFSIHALHCSQNDISTNRSDQNIPPLSDL